MIATSSVIVLVNGYTMRREYRVNSVVKSALEHLYLYNICMDYIFTFRAEKWVS